MPHFPPRSQCRSTLLLHSSTWIGIAIAFYAFIAIGRAESGLGVLLPPSLLLTISRLQPLPFCLSAE
ncbi:hypothetical protein [Thermocoleostomius sinensis]|uniref:Uncharacterized protein n=1 Tax=Thermocoleostomius sinensis A174 TaxID=2016057 RepID=A0A9E9CB23_9CYAN|nr:hypothetical protein [Thermocoleostomius sinensis]WAL59690.1 hypothetical protein OXH18_21340 [Thermocoleostomius sinensis A174]